MHVLLLAADRRHDDAGRRAALLVVHARASAPTPSTRPTSRSCAFYLRGLWYSATVLAILGCHEMGHYLACRYYRVDASLPFFLPAPLPLDRHARRVHPDPRSASRRRSRCSTSGSPDRSPDSSSPCPTLFIGLALSVDRTRARRLHRRRARRAAALPRGGVAGLGHVPDGMSINMHPMAFAAWFGLLATALNLFPDRAARWRTRRLRRASAAARRIVTLARCSRAIGLTVLSRSSWIVWTVLMVVMVVVDRARIIRRRSTITRRSIAPRVILAVVGTGDADRVLHAGADRAVRDRRTVRRCAPSAGAGPLGAGRSRACARAQDLRPAGRALTTRSSDRRPPSPSARSRAVLASACFRAPCASPRATCLSGRTARDVRRAAA